jgi:hypothetical protein
MIGIIIVSILTAAGFFAALGSFIGIIRNFRKDKGKMKRNCISFGVFFLAFAGLGCLNTVLILKKVYDSRDQIAGAADSLIIGAIDKTAEYTTRSVLATASAYSKIYNTNIIKKFENLKISYLTSKFEIHEDKKIYEIELALDNNIPQQEELYFGDLVVKNYLIACDEDDFVYDIVPEDADTGLTQYGELVLLMEYLLNREYSKFGKILPGKTRHKILVEVPENVNITSVRFLDRKIEIEPVPKQP